MPLNIKKSYQYVPQKSAAAVQLISRSARRARLWNESFYRSKEIGQQANEIQVGIFEDGAEAVFITHHRALVPAEMVAANFSVPNFSLYSCSLNWDQEIRITVEGSHLVAKLYGIRWQISGGPPAWEIAVLGRVVKDRVFSSLSATFKISAGPADFPAGGTIYIRPRVRRYPLVMTSVTDPETMTSSMGWSIDDLRGALAADSSGWVTMPARAPKSEGGLSIGPGQAGEDVNDTDQDADFLVPFGMTALSGGDGLPLTPVGLRTGPDRTLVHLNYSELQDGSLGNLNHIFEWVGDSAVVGSWQRYA